MSSCEDATLQHWPYCPECSRQDQDVWASNSGFVFFSQSSRRVWISRSLFRPWENRRRFTETSYDWLVTAYREQPVYYQQIGRKQGEWLLVTNRAPGSAYRFYVSYYGSCSGCDPLTYFFRGFVIEPLQRMIDNLADSLRLIPKQAHPAHILGAGWNLYDVIGGHELDYVEAERQIRAAVCLIEGGQPTVEDILCSNNTEIQRDLLGRMGNERFVEEAGAAEIACDQQGRQILQAGEMSFVRVRCPSTGRWYVLRIPPFTTDIDEAVAWTFRRRPEQYRPSKET